MTYNEYIVRIHELKGGISVTRKKKDFRELKASSSNSYGYKSTPMVRLQGLGLEKLGFNIGDPILVKCEEDFNNYLYKVWK